MCVEREFTCVVDFLCDVDALSVGQAAIDRRPRGRRQGRVEGVDVEAQMEGPLTPGPHDKVEVQRPT